MSSASSAKSLGNMLGSLSPNSKKKKMSGSATVSGSDVRSEIYIRPDGKKVRRVLKAKPSSDAASVGGGGGAADDATMGGNSSVGGGASTAIGEVYIRPDGKKVRRVLRKASSSVHDAATATAPDTSTVASGDNGPTGSIASSTASSSGLTGFLNASTHLPPPRGSSATVTGAEQGEIYIRPDGKKVRRIKRTPSSAVSPATSTATSSSTTLDTTAPPPSASKLTGFLNSNSTAPLRGAASVSGAEEVGEIYINAAGKKVRRVKRIVSSATLTPATTSSSKSTSSASSALGGFLDATSSPVRRGAASVGGDVLGDKSVGEVYINAQGKKVRRVKKVVSGGGASVSGDEGTVATSTPSIAAATKAKSIAEGEIYIRPDGKKVRRVKRSNSSVLLSSSTPAIASIPSATLSTPAAPQSPTPTSPGKSGPSKSLEGFLGRTSPKKGAMSGSATVAGDRVSSKIDGGEIYINAEGKKVRRVRKQRATPLGLTQSILQERGMAAAAAALAAQTSTPPQLQKSSLSELPKMPLEVDDDLPNGTATKEVSKPALPQAPELESKPEVLPVPAPPPSRFTPDSKRDEPSSTNTSSDNGAAARSGLQNLLQSHNGTSRPGAASSPTVSGDTAPAASKSLPQEGEIYIRPDGKKVRRVRRTASNSVAAMSSTASLGRFLQQEGGKAPKLSGAATVVGDRKLDGEIIIRPDGKKVIRRARSKMVGTETEGEVYRNAEGKLVRRVKRTTSNAAKALAPARPTEKAPSTTSNPAHSQGTDENVDSNAKPTADHPVAKFSRRSSMSRAGDPSKPVIPLSDGEEAIAVGYRKMLRMGLPEDAVRHKMTVSDVAPKIIAAVMGDEWKEETATKAAVPDPASDEALSNLLAVTAALNSTSNASTNVPALALPSGEERPTETPLVQTAPLSEPDPCVRPNSETTTVSNAPKVELNKETSQRIMAVDVGDSKIGDIVSSHALPSSPAVALTEDEEDMAAPFRRMKKMGLPDDAVRHKMLSSDIPAKIMAAVLCEVWVSESSTPTLSTEDKTSSTVLEENEATIAQYRKMLQMGLPDDAVRHKMVLAEVDEEIIAAVFSRTSEDEPSIKPTTTGVLSAEEEAVVAQYRKMRQMGLPDDVVRHKMIVNEVDPKIISAVFQGPLAPPVIESHVDARPTAENKSGTSTLPSKSYGLVVGDEPIVSAGLDETNNNSSVSLNPDEKYAVKVADESNGSSPRQNTKFLTLEELARLSGQTEQELEAIVSEKKKRGASPPRFTLQPLVERKYEVSIPIQTAEVPPAAEAPPLAIPAGTDPKKVAVVNEGQEVVDSQLAKAARAVSALGDGDMSALFEKLKAGDMKDLLEKLHEAEKRQKKLEKQLAQAGVAIAEDIEYNEAKGKVEQIAKRMNEIGGSDVILADKDAQNRLREEYFKLEQEMERYNTALMLSEEYQAEQDRLEKKWEADNEPDNIEALKKIRRHMPVNVRHLSEADLTTKPSPNGKYLPVAIAKKFKRTNILQCLRLNPDDLESMHPATLENMRVTGLTLTERRALYIHFKPVGPKWEKNKAEKMTERKWTWYQMMKNNFKENVAPYQRHVDQYGGPKDHTCPLLGKQCPIRADKMPDYDGDYGWTDAAEYEVSDVRKADVEDSGAKAMAEALELAKEKKANERADLLKKHYKGKLLQVSKANGGCEAMDESMDHMENNTIRWIEFMLDKGENESQDDKNKEVANFVEALNEFKLKLLNFAQRSGMQTSGKRTAGGGSPDIRSVVEASLAEEVYETSREWFTWIRDRMKKLGILDTRGKKTIEMLDEILNELHTRNLAAFEALGVKRMNRSRKLRTNADLLKEVEDKRKAKEEPEIVEVSHAAPLAGGRGGLMDAIAGRGGGGRGGLMDAIAGRGRGGEGGRGGLMDAIAGRGRGGGGDGRGGLLDAIAGRGRGGGDGGGRGGLMAAIAGRGAGRGGRGGGDAGGRGGLMAAIAARGGSAD